MFTRHVDAAAAARHEELLCGQRKLQAAAHHAQVLAEQEAERKAEQRATEAEHMRRQECFLAAVPDQLQHMTMAALKVADKVMGTALETTEAAQSTVAAAQELAWTAKELVDPKASLIAAHVLADGVKEVQMTAAHAARAWAPASAAFRPMIDEQKRGLEALRKGLRATRMKVVAKKEAEREEGEISE